MKKYWHSESVYTIYDENIRLCGIIGFSQIAHEDSPDIKFVRFLAYCRPLWADEFKLFYDGEFRWDGFMLGTETPIIHLKGMDDLLTSILIKFAIYDIAYNELYLTYINDNYKQIKGYAKMTELFDFVITYRNVFEKEDMLTDKYQKLCETIRDNLTEMSEQAIKLMERSKK